MMWFLLVCTNVVNAPVCLPLQRMPSRAACLFVAERYRDAGAQRYDDNQPSSYNIPRTRCLAVK